MLVLGVIQNLKKTGHFLDLWSEAGADGVAFTVPIDGLDGSFFDNAKSARDRGMRVAIHPFEVGKFIYTPTDLGTHGFSLEKLAFTMDNIKALGLEPFLVIHPPRLAVPDAMLCGKQEIDEKTALDNSIPFYDKLSRIAAQSSVSIAIENMHDPYANPGHSLYGYNVEQLGSICNGRGFGICVDTGHAKLSMTSVSEYVNSPLNIITVHLQGNDGKFDQHQLPNMKNVGDVEGVMRLLALNVPIIIEANSQDLLKKEDESWEGTVSEISGVVQAVRQRTLPPG
ncbi:MAG: TIM barrel protein, partial [Candidatus Micrarchaeota archaeon]